MKTLFFISFVAIALSISSCTDDVGGNANMSTVDFVVHENDWDVYGTEGKVGYGFAVDLSFPELTNNVIQNGMVSLYVKSNDAWIPVPVYFYYQSDQTLYQGGFFYRMKQGTFSIDYYESDGLTDNPGTNSFRLVIVQPY